MPIPVLVKHGIQFLFDGVWNRIPSIRIPSKLVAIER